MRIEDRKRSRLENNNYFIYFINLSIIKEMNTASQAQMDLKNGTKAYDPIRRINAILCTK